MNPDGGSLNRPWQRLLSSLAPRRATRADVYFLHQLLFGRDPRAGEIEVFEGDDLLRLVAELADSWEHREWMRRAQAPDVLQLYRTLLRREPETDLVVEHRIGRPLLEVIRELAQADERQSMSATTTPADVERLYQAFLNRSPEQPAAITSRVGLPLTEVAIEIGRSPEAWLRHGLSLEEVQESCEAILGARPDQAWLETLQPLLRSYCLGRVALLDHLRRMHERRHGVTASEAESTPASETGSEVNHAFAPLHHFGTAITLVVPTINAAAWLPAIIDFYAGLGIRPLFAVDQRTSDHTCALLDGARQDWITVSGHEPRVEALMPAILERIRTPWVLRLDDDELPTPALLACCDAAIDEQVGTVGFARLNLRKASPSAGIDASQFLTVARHVDWDRQWRLFRPGDVRVHDRLHTPGFDTRSRRPAPPAATLLHLDWIIRSEARRRRKQQTYDSQQTAATHPRSVVWEDVPDDWHLFVPIELTWLDAVVAHVHQAAS